MRTYRSCSLPVHKVTGSAAGEQWPPLVGYESDLHTYECDFHVETWQYKDKWMCFFNNKTTSTVLVSCVCVNMCCLYWAFQCEPSSSKHSHSMGGWLFFSLCSLSPFLHFQVASGLVLPCGLTEGRKYYLVQLWPKLIYFSSLGEERSS